MQNNPFVVFNAVLFVVFSFITLICLEGVQDLSDSVNTLLLAFSLTGILSQIYIINKRLSDRY